MRRWRHPLPIAALAAALASWSSSPVSSQSTTGSWPARPTQAPLETRWAKVVTPETAHREYPRPQFVRTDWLNLNGLWEYAITAADATQPTAWISQ